ncbi:hypothetical protein TWF718_001976 [Orbilia javanica]|uniref:Uncharacterized protein n=1 Tax=Orbilia javanica TaxID=47235 RepID=A0AAN8NEP3_9PEZI
MPNPTNDAPGRRARGADEEEEGVYYSESQNPSGFPGTRVPTTSYLRPHTPTLSLDDGPSLSQLNYRKRAASKSISGRLYPCSDSSTSALTQTRSPKRHCSVNIPSSPSSQSSASTTFKFSSKSERIRKARQFVDGDNDLYHPTYAPYNPIAQRASWPLINSTTSMLQGYPDHIEALDMATSESRTSMDSGVDLCELKTEHDVNSWMNFNMVHIGAWANDREHCNS